MSVYATNRRTFPTEDWREDRGHELTRHAMNGGDPYHGQFNHNNNWQPRQQPRGYEQHEGNNQFWREQTRVDPLCPPEWQHATSSPLNHQFWDMEKSSVDCGSTTSSSNWAKATESMTGSNYGRMHDSSDAGTTISSEAEYQPSQSPSGNGHIPMSPVLGSVLSPRASEFRMHAASDICDLYADDDLKDAPPPMSPMSNNYFHSSPPLQALTPPPLAPHVFAGKAKSDGRGPVDWRDNFSLFRNSSPKAGLHEIEHSEVPAQQAPSPVPTKEVETIPVARQVPSHPLAAKVVKLNNGREMPVVAFGTGSKWIGKDVTRAVRWALEAGYMHFDCAELYENVGGLGEEFAKYLSEHPEKKREDYFFTVKLSHCIDDKKHPLIGVKKMLDILGISYVDLLLIHSPYEKNGQGRRRRDLNDIWAGMEDLVEVGLVKSIGVSNFRISDLELLMKVSRIRPVVNQVETHASLMQMGLRKFMDRANIVTASYGNTVPARYQPDPKLLELLDKLSVKYGKTHCQLLIRFNIERGIQVVTTSSKEKHINENAAVLDFKISDADMENIVNVARNAAPKEKYWKVKCGFHINTNVW